MTRRKPVAVFRSTCLARNSATSASVAWASRARSVAQPLGERVGERPWLKQLDDVSIGHGVSLLCWRSGGSNNPTIPPLFPVRPSPTAAHSSVTREEKASEYFLHHWGRGCCDYSCGVSRSAHLKRHLRFHG